MATFTPEGEKVIATLADQYKIGSDAVRMMFDAVAKGGGGAAQFNLPEFGGAGHWMRGGGATIGDMVSSSMKGTVDNLCTELSNLMEAQASLFTPSTQSETAKEEAEASAPAAFSSHGWWPAELGEPANAGSRNTCRYAYFPSIRRLAVDLAGKVEVYDTTGFDIEGLTPRQAKGARPVFASNRGPVKLDSLPRAYGITAEKTAAPEAKKQQAPAAAPMPTPAPAEPKALAMDAAEIIAIIEQLATLKDKGILTDAEFSAKKAELLKRI
jgi:hypothetical protein